MVIFTKISVLGVLLLSVINTSEARRRHRVRYKPCKCETTEPATETVPTEESLLKTTETIVRTTTTDNIPKEEEETTTINTTTKEITPATEKNVNGIKSGKPLGLSLIPLLDLTKDVKPVQKENSISRIHIKPAPVIVGHIDHHERISPTNDEAIIKSWILNHPDNKQGISLNHDIKWSDNLSKSRSLYTQGLPQQQYFTIPQNKFDDYNYDIEPLLSKNIVNPFQYVVHAQDSKIPPKIVHVSRVNEQPDKYHLLHQYGVGTELKQIKLPHITVPENQHIPAYAQTIPQPFEYQATHDNEHGNLKQKHHVPVSQISVHKLPTIQNTKRMNEHWRDANINILNDIDIDGIDKNELGYAVLQILGQNGMHISGDGMLIDTLGKEYNIHSLNLTPILIGDTLSLRNLLQGKYEQTPVDLQTQYLQAVLVSTTHPSKVLGIMPLGTAYLPCSFISSLSNTPHISRKSGATEKANEPSDAIKSIKEKIKNIGVLPRDNDKVAIKHREQKPVSNKININGDENSERWKQLGLSLHSSRLWPNNIDLPEDIQAISRTNSLHDAHALLGEDAGRIFLPDIGLRQQIARLVSHDAAELDNTLNSDSAYSRIEIPGISNLLDIALKGKALPINVKSLLELNNEAEAQKAATISGIFESVQEPAIDVLHDLKLTGNVPHVAGETVFTRRVNMPIHTISVTHSPIYRKSFNIHTIPIAYSRVSDLNIPDHIPMEELIASRNGGQYQLPEIPPEVNNGNSVVDVAENDDDDDGDFRIIGGNAATGSGTPLSNKGRSGNMA